MQKTLEKILCMHIASTLTSAVVGNFPDEVKIDPTLEDAGLRGCNLATWEIFKVFHSAVVKAVDNETFSSPTSSILDVILPVVGEGSALKPIIMSTLMEFLKGAGLPSGIASVIPKVVDELNPGKSVQMK